VRERLRELQFASERASNTSLGAWYIEVVRQDGALIPGGTYTVKSGSATFDLTLQRDGVILRRRTVTAAFQDRSKDLPEAALTLAKLIVEMANER
jgi:hypothetical protein